MLTPFPTVLSCVFAAYLYGGPEYIEHRYQPIPNPTAECTFQTWIRRGEFHIRRNGHEVFIALPIHKGWYRLQYDWGEDQAYMTVPGGETWYPISVRIGSAEFY